MLNSAHLGALLVAEVEGALVALGRGRRGARHVIKIVVSDAFPDQVLQRGGCLLGRLRGRSHRPLKVQIHFQRAIQRPGACSMGRCSSPGIVCDQTSTSWSVWPRPDSSCQGRF